MSSSSTSSSSTSSSSSSSYQQQLFATGDELSELREDLTSLKQNLEWAKALKDEARIESLEKAIRMGQNKDPFYMYEKARKIIAHQQQQQQQQQQQAYNNNNDNDDGSDDDGSEEEEDRKALIEKWSAVESNARKFLPHLNMEGLWVGDYGENKGLQLINITYTGNSLEMIATKVTGDRNVPRGKRSFTVNVQPCNASALPPVRLERERQSHPGSSSSSSSSSTSSEFYRFPGKGQVSRKGFKDHRFVEGQMVLFDHDKFSFVWIPTKHHVLFTRPDPQTTLRLLRNTLSKEDELANTRDHLAKCFDMDLSTAIARQQDPFRVREPLRRISTQEELDAVEERFKEQQQQQQQQQMGNNNSKNPFLQIGRWRNYIDQVLDKN
eukprot:jgi/Psemu1/207634/e_gw1.442.3.1